MNMGIFFSATKSTVKVNAWGIIIHVSKYSKTFFKKHLFAIENIVLEVKPFRLSLFQVLVCKVVINLKRKLATLKMLIFLIL